MRKAGKRQRLPHLVFVLLFTFSCFTMASDGLGGYWGAHSTKFIFIKFLIVFLTVGLAVVQDYLACRSFHFIAAAAPIISNTALLCFFLDYYITGFSGSKFLYRALWAGYLLCAQCALLLFALLCTGKRREDGFVPFYKNFWYGFTPYFVCVFLLVFARNPFAGGTATVNLIPFKGTFKMLYAMLDGMRGGFEPPLLFFGNFLFFIPYGFLVPFYMDKTKWPAHLAVGFLTPVCIEAYQYIFNCGDADVDDLILNITGFLLGYLLFVCIQKFYIRKKGNAL